MGAEVKPDWVIVGWREGEGCAVLASKDLLKSEMQSDTEVQRDWVGRAIRSDTLHRLGVDMTHFTLIVAQSYGDCLRHLFDIWSPEEDDTPAIRPAQHRIEG